MNGEEEQQNTTLKAKERVHGRRQMSERGSHTQILRYPREQRQLEGRGFNTLQETSTEVREDLHKGTEVGNIFEPVHSALKKT